MARRQNSKSRINMLSHQSILQRYALLALLLLEPASSLVQPSVLFHSRQNVLVGVQSQSQLYSSRHMEDEDNTIHNRDETVESLGGRRGFLTKFVLAATSSSMVLWSDSATAQAASDLPMITTEEFGILLRQSAQAIRVVEFSGPQSETVTVRLVDGTAFGLSDVIESPVDPRSPLKIAAQCRENRVPTQFVALQAALAKAPKRNVLYTNERVLEAAQKEREKQARIQQDELAQLFQQQQLQEQQQQLKEKNP